MSESISFGTWLYQRRRALDLTQKALASQIGCAEITIRRMEADTYKPSNELANVLCEKLGVSNSDRAQWVRFARGLAEYPNNIQNTAHTDPPNNNLPGILKSFVGRKKEQAEIVHLIQNHRIVTLVGTGGIGKTSLALQLGHKLLGEYSDGVWFFALDSLSMPAYITQTIASAFNLQESSERPILEALTGFLHAKNALLILDNCEHLLTGCAQLITTLLGHCPNIKIISTSREILGISGEAVYLVKPLKAPQQFDSPDILNDNESIQLFEQRTRLTEMDFELTKDNILSIAHICEWLEGIPLAIELAAAYMDILQPHEILQQLKNNFDLLFNQESTAIPRHQTMRASIVWSWSLLNDNERRLMQQLTIFSGGWTLESAQIVCDGDALNLIKALVRKSLIVVNKNLGDETRYYFHEIIRQFANEKLLKSDLYQEIRDRHLRYFLVFSEQAESALKGSKQVSWYEHLQNEHHNIRAALDWAYQTNIEAGLYISGMLFNFWESTSVYEGIQWLDRFLQKPESHSHPQARAKALYARAGLANWVNEFELAYVTALECLTLYRACDDKSGQADGLLMLGGAYEYTARPGHIELYKESLEISQSIGDLWRQAQAYTTLGSIDISFPEQGVAIFKKVGDIELAIENIISCLATHELMSGNYSAAQKWFDEALTLSFDGHEPETGNGDANGMDGIHILSQRLRNRSWLAFILQIWGRIAFASRRLEEAHFSLQKSIQIAEETGHSHIRLWSRTHLGYATMYQGNNEESRKLFVDATQEFIRIKLEAGIVFSLDGMATLFTFIGAYTDTARLIGLVDSRRETFRHPRPPNEHADMSKVIHECLFKMGETAFAEAYEAGKNMTLEKAIMLAQGDA